MRIPKLPVIWMPLAWIPNQVGFRLIIRKKNGERVETKVVKDATGMHTIEGIEFKDCRSWANINP